MQVTRWNSACSLCPQTYPAGWRAGDQEGTTFFSRGESNDYITLEAMTMPGNQQAEEDFRKLISLNYEKMVLLSHNQGRKGM